MIPPKVKIFTWRLLNDILLTGSELRGREMHSDGICRRCGVALETPEHVFRDSVWSSTCWYTSCFRLDVAS